jgi:hypothetical protein
MSNTSEKAKSNASQSLNDDLFDCTDSQADQDRSNDSQDSWKVKLVILISMLIMPGKNIKIKMYVFIY